MQTKRGNQKACLEKKVFERDAKHGALYTGTK